MSYLISEMPPLKPEDLPQFAEINPELAELVATNPLPAIDFSDIQVALKAIDELQAVARSYYPECPASEVEEEDHQYKNRDGKLLRFRVYRRPGSNAAAKAPLVVHFHGGGGAVGTPEDEGRNARDYVRAFGVVSVAPQYRLGPVHPFPCGVNDCWDFLKWIAGNATSFNADPSLGFIVTGVSQGATLSASMAHLARDNKLSPPLTGCHVSCGPILPYSVTPEEYKPWHLSEIADQDLILKKASSEAMEAGYQPDWSSPLCAPATFPSGHADLPRTFIQAAGMDLIRDCSVIYDMMLREAGVETRFQIYKGVPHAWFHFLPMLKMSDLYRKEELEGMGWLLGKQPEAQPL